MPEPQNPPLPAGYEGYQPVQAQAAPSASSPPLPAGYENYKPAAPADSDSQVEKPFSLDPMGPDAAPAGVRDIPGFAKNVAVGAGKNLATAARGVSNIARAGGIPAPEIPAVSPVTGPGQHIGDWMTDLATFKGGEKLVDLVGTLSHLSQVPEVLELMEKYPKTVNILRGMTSGAIQGGVKGAADGEGVKGAVGGAVGAGVGTAATEGSADLIKKLLGYGLSEEEAKQMVSSAGKYQPALNVSKGDVLEHAASEGIKLTPGQATQGPPARMIQAVGERSLAGSTKLANAMDEQSASLLDSVDRFADRVDPSKHGGNSFDEAGTNIKTAVENGKQAKWTQTKAAYAPIDQKYSKVPVDTSAIQSDWSQLADKEKVVLDNAPKEIRSKLAEVFEKGKNLGTEVPSKTGNTINPSLPFSDAQKLRSFFFEMGQTSNAELPERYQGLFTKLAKDLSGEMDKSANAAGFAPDWKTADAGWKDYVEKYGDKQSPLRQIMNTDDPAKVAKTLVSRKSIHDLDILQQEKLTPAIDAMKRRVVEDITNQHFRIGKNGLGGYPDAYLQKLFGAQDAKELYLKAEIGRRFRWEMNPSGTSNVMMAEHQLTHPTPSKLGIPVGAAKASMPRDAEKYLPGGAPSGLRTGAATVGGAAGASAGEKVEITNPHDLGPTSENDWIHFTDSSGRVLQVHPEDWQEVLKRDPGAKPIEPTESAENSAEPTPQDSGASSDTESPQTV